MVFNTTLLILLLVLVVILFLLRFLNKMKNKNELHRHFTIFVGLLTIPLISLSLQILFSNINIPPIYFDYFTYIFTLIAPIEILKIAFLFSNPDIKFKNINILYAVSMISLLVLWTNDIHHLFYKVYSINFNQTIFGEAFYLISAYAYIVLIVGVTILISGTIKRSGFFSKQTMMIFLGILVPLAGNVLGVLKIIEMSIYVTPILFVILAICFSIAIFKFKALNLTPVASKTIMDIMSDAYVVISNDGTIIDTNKTFVKMFQKNIDFRNGDNLFEIIEKNKLFEVDKLKDIIKTSRKNKNIQTVEFHANKNSLNKYFDVDISPVSSRLKSTDYIGTLLLFKDITQHKEDIKQIQEKQDIIVKQGQLVSIGELAGGVAHDINTPISAIKTGILMLNQMGDRTEEEKEMLQRMDNCATKIINIVNSMRNQIRNLGGDTIVEFKISDVINDIKVITFHEAKKNNSEVIVDIQKDLKIQGDPTKLGQVLTNLVVNAIQAYGTEKGGIVEVTVTNKNAKAAIIKVKDYAGGLDESIAPFVFKNILTTKGTNGTGLGLYLAYSVIKGNFNGDITFSTKKGEGTIFNITLPIK